MGIHLRVIIESYLINTNLTEITLMLLLANLANTI